MRLARRAPHEREIVWFVVRHREGFVLAVLAREVRHHVVLDVRATEFQLDDVIRHLSVPARRRLSIKGGGARWS